ncbi:CD20-like domain-containing protein [Streptococcus anginosus]|uniref:CD20-like domain-containing protein n=1 Tax=Streptococcus anginosus TaxID=1328 RepID=UPI0021F816B4|nr:CD20-like domain-containing protein [Streptococcus anginosus]MCW1006759.1 CD20-like domain-containing protein [Streptococcus anginosus]
MKQDESKVLGILAIVFGGIALIGSWVPILNNLSFMIGIVALILGVIALIVNRKRKKVLAIVGTSLAFASCVIVLITQSFYGAAVDNAAKEVKKTSQSIEKSYSKEEAKEKEKQKAADAKFKWTQEYYNSLKEGDFETGEGGSNYNDIVAKVGEPTVRDEGTDQLEVEWKNEDGSQYQSVSLSFKKQSDGTWLLYDKLSMF